jgi:hypothetical protein
MTLRKIRVACIDSGFKAGAFALAIDSTHWFLKIAALMTNLRCRLNRLPHGDQAQYFRTDFFRNLGGYREIPLFEDVDIMKRIHGFREHRGIRAGTGRGVLQLLPQRHGGREAE